MPDYSHLVLPFVPFHYTGSLFPFEVTRFLVLFAYLMCLVQRQASVNIDIESQSKFHDEGLEEPLIQQGSGSAP